MSIGSVAEYVATPGVYLTSHKLDNQRELNFLNL